MVLIDHLSENVEIEYCKPDLVAKVLKHTIDKLVNLYESEYRNLFAKEILYKSLHGKRLDEGEIIVDKILAYREALFKTLEFIYSTRSNSGVAIHELFDESVISGKLHDIYLKVVTLNKVLNRFQSDA